MSRLFLSFKIKKVLIILFWILIWQILYIASNKEILIVSPLSVLKNFMIKLNSFIEKVLLGNLRGKIDSLKNL